MVRNQFSSASVNISNDEESSFTFFCYSIFYLAIVVAFILYVIAFFGDTSPHIVFRIVSNYGMINGYR